MQCPSCGASVSDRAASCAICGQVLSVEAAVAGARGGRTVAPAWRASATTLPPEPGPHRCAACESRLEPGATFCSECGNAVITSEYAIPDFPEPVEATPAAEPYVTTVEEPVEISPDLATTLPPVPEEPEYYVDDVVVPEPIPIVHHDPAVYVPVAPASAPAKPDDVWSWVPPAAAAFAVFALLVALLVHLAAPSSLAGYSAAELSLKIQMRAVEWLLAGGVIGIVGLLLKR